MKIDHIKTSKRTAWNKGVTHTLKTKEKIGIKRIEYFNSLTKKKCRIEGCGRMATIPRGKNDIDLGLCVSHRTIEHRKEYYKMFPDKEEDAKQKAREYKKEYTVNNKKRISETLWRWRENLKNKIISHYSNGTMECAICGHSDRRALCLDHINNDGAEHRRSLDKNGNKKNVSNTSVYQSLLKQNFPEGYQVLCHNCNFIKEFERKTIERKRRYED